MWGSLRHIMQLETQLGTVQIELSFNGLLSKISINNYHSKNHLKKFHLQSEQEKRACMGFQDRKVISGYVQNLLEEIRLYFESGRPIEKDYWGDIDFSNTSEFQKRVYEAALKVPHGETRTYSWVAERIGKPTACRAVGQALKTNPFPVLIPCHRIVSSLGGLGGFMGKKDPNDPELSLKKNLLELEHNYRNPVFSFLLKNSRGMTRSSRPGMSQTA